MLPVCRRRDLSIWLGILRSLLVLIVVHRGHLLIDRSLTWERHVNGLRWSYLHWSGLMQEGDWDLSVVCLVLIWVMMLFLMMIRFNNWHMYLLSVAD